MSSVNIESPGDGYQARVDSSGRLFTRSACIPHTLTTSTGSFDNTTPVTLAVAMPGRCWIAIQAQGNDLMVRFEDDDPAAGDLIVAAGTTFTLPISYEGEVRGLGATGSGFYAVIEGRQATS